MYVHINFEIVLYSYAFIYICMYIQTSYPVLSYAIHKDHMALKSKEQNNGSLRYTHTYIYPHTYTYTHTQHNTHKHTHTQTHTHTTVLSFYCPGWVTCLSKWEGTETVRAGLTPGDAWFTGSDHDADA